MHAARALSPDRRKFAVIPALLVAQAALVFAIVFPGYKPTPHRIPVGFVGSSVVEASLATKAGGELSIRTYPSPAAARSAIDHREIYGAFIVRPGDQQLLVASAASPSVSQLLRETATASNAAVRVTDVVPLTADDPHGATIGLLFMPLIMVSFVSVLALGSLTLRPARMIGAVALLALLGGAVVTTLASVAFGALPGPFLALSAVMTLTMLAIALPTAGFHRLFGPAGVGLGALVFMFIANPASGNGTPPEMLPGFWRSISQLMPPGAGGTALRNISYFGGNALLRPLLVLIVFAALGAGLTAAADTARRRRSQRVLPPESADLDPVPPAAARALQVA